MNIETIIAEAADTLRELPELAGVPVIEEDKGDVSKELQSKIAKASVAVVVGWNGFTPKIQGDTAPDGLVGVTRIVCSVFEKPVVNRAKADAPRLLGVAKAIALALNCAAAEGMDAPLYCKGISAISELPQSEGSVVTCDVDFETTSVL